MSFKTLPLLALSFGLLSGCTNSCTSQTPTPSEQQALEAPATELQEQTVTEEQVVNTDTVASETVVSETEAETTVATAE